jgi:hypothetical protein
LKRRDPIPGSRVALVAMVLLAALGPGCGSSPTRPLLDWTVPRFAADQASFTDDDVRAAYYSRYRSPGSFYREDGYGVTAPYYVNTISVHDVCCRPSVWIELSTEDVGQARAWAESTVAHSSNAIPSPLGPVRVEERFFEFPRGSDRAVPMRVHRLSYLDRSMFDRLAPDSLIGVLQSRPIDAGAARDVAEYLWFLDHRSRRNPVLSSFGFEEGMTLVHVVYDVEVTSGPRCDQLRLRRLEYRVAVPTGEIVLRVTLVRTIEGECREYGWSCTPSSRSH